MRTALYCTELPCYRYITLFRQTLFRQTLFRQSTVGTSGSWLQLNRLRTVPIGKMPNQIPKIRGLYEPHIGSGISKFWYESLKSQTQYEWGSNCLSASINAVLLMHATPRHPLLCFSNFYYFYICLRVLKMYWVVMTADCRNSVCRNWVCRNSVCLPLL